MSARRAFITGITGQDGGYLAERLLADGWEVHGLVRPDDDTTPTFEGADDVVLHRQDILDHDAVDAIVADVAPEHVYNLAGMSSVALAWERPRGAARINAVGAVGLMEAAWRVQERTGTPVRFVQASSAEIFGQPDTAPQDESTPLRPVNPYGAAKAYAHLCAGVYRARGLHASSLVLYNHESPRRPESFVTRKITAAVARIAQGSDEVLALGNLDARRDWGWAPDYVDAMFRMATHETGDDFVVATGVDHSIADFAAAMFEAKSDVSAFSDAELLRMDSKEYNVAGKELRVSVLETTAPQVLLDRKAALMAAMSGVAAADGADEVLLFVVLIGGIVAFAATRILGGGVERLAHLLPARRRGGPAAAAASARRRRRGRP